MPKMELHDVYLVIADISGYTNFVKLHKASVLHAEEIVSELMEALIDTIEQPLTLNKLEGDAAFFYAKAGTDRTTAGQVTQRVLLFFDAFKDKQNALIKACCNIDQLKLKTILHYGRVVIKQVHQLEELAGEDVILSHRLLKNTIAASEYILMTEPFYQLSGGVKDKKPVAHTETYDLGEVKTVVYYPETPPAVISETPRMTRFSGILQGSRLFLQLFRRRLRGPQQTFSNIPT
jgi:class 3 adenylate cyclase